jgi:HSP20 family protein
MLVQWTPFANSGIARSASPKTAFDELFRDADRLLEASRVFPNGWAKTSGAPAADIYETQEHLVFKLDIPGYDPKNVNIQVEGDVLTVEAQRTRQETQQGHWLRQERTVDAMARSFVLPHTVDASKCEATAENGVLTLTLPKREEAKPRSISVKVHS